MILIAMTIGLIGGLILGFGLDITYPAEFSFYITMALLASLDSILGAARAQFEDKYNGIIFFTGFITNAILAAALTYLGDLLGVPLYYAAIFVFGGRLFNNLAMIRRIVVEKYVLKKDTNQSKK
ncbi:small basic family protein [Sinanaerobacter sp. ZZT-01]|uniref:small basic family protein n=1 Tax=Sinanaerobacter sp. ZZT-01 TaxID=3111540 RepID=UPI003A96AA5E